MDSKIKFPTLPSFFLLPRLRTRRVLTRNDALPARRLGAHLPRRRPIQRELVHGLGQLVDRELLVQSGAREDAAFAGTVSFEVGRGEGDELSGGECTGHHGGVVKVRNVLGGQFDVLVAGLFGDEGEDVADRALQKRSLLIFEEHGNGYSRVRILPPQALQPPVGLYGAQRRVVRVERVVRRAAQFERNRGAFDTVPLSVSPPPRKIESTE